MGRVLRVSAFDDVSPPDFAGPATVVVDDAEFPVTVELRGIVQPIDGIYRWYGRVAPSSDLDAAVGIRNRPVRVRTDVGEAEAVIGDRDFWSRYRLTGRSRPPFRTDYGDAAETTR